MLNWQIHVSYCIDFMFLRGRSCFSGYPLPASSPTFHLFVILAWMKSEQVRSWCFTPCSKPYFLASSKKPAPASPPSLDSRTISIMFKDVKPDMQQKLPREELFLPQNVQEMRETHGWVWSALPLKFSGHQEPYLSRVFLYNYLCSLRTNQGPFQSSRISGSFHQWWTYDRVGGLREGFCTAECFPETIL